MPDSKIALVGTKLWIVLLLILTLLSINACSVVMANIAVTNYDNKMNRDTSRDEVHKLLGQPLSSETYGRPLASKDIKATWPCCSFFGCSDVDNATQRNREIIGYEVFTIKGVVQNSDSIMNPLQLFLYDIASLGFAEILFFPMVTIEWIDETMTEKDMTVWYGTNNTFEGAEVRYKCNNNFRTNKFITFVPNCYRPNFRK